MSMRVSPRRLGLFVLAVAIVSGASAQRLRKVPAPTQVEQMPASYRGGLVVPPLPKPRFTLTDTSGAPFDFWSNTQGVVTSRFFEQAYQERSTVGSIMARLGNKVNVQATAFSSPQLEMTSFATDSTVAPGTRFSLVLDVRPARGVHVYAPGVTGYKPITLSVEAQPGLITRGAQYPRSEDYHFKPLNEHVPVYQRPFRIVQDVLIDASPQAQTSLKDMTSITIEGVLNYQACDDKVCFTPQTVPLTWTVSLRQLDRERARP